MTPKKRRREGTRLLAAHEERHSRAALPVQVCEPRLRQAARTLAGLLHAPQALVIMTVLLPADRPYGCSGGESI
jgi:hypothetical protein